MAANDHEIARQSSEKSLLNTELGKFCIKTGIVLVGIFILISIALPDFGEIKHDLKRFETPKSKLILLSFVQNPAALWKISEIEETEDKTANAIREMELAVGLLETHGAEKQTIKRYSDRIEKLKAKNN